MEYRYLILGLVAFILIYILNNYRYKLKVRKYLKNSFGKDGDYSFSKNDREKYLKEGFLILTKYFNKNKIVDDITWNDLDMIKVFDKIDKSNSTIGAQGLYYKLRTLDNTDEELNYFQNLVGFFRKNEDIRSNVQEEFNMLGRAHNLSVLKTLENGFTMKIFSPIFYIILGIMPIASLLLFFVNPTLAFGMFFIAIIINITYTLIYKKFIDMDINSIFYLINSIDVGKKVLKYNVPVNSEFKKLIKTLSSIKKYTFGLSNSVFKGEFDFIKDYIEFVFMLPFISFSLSKEKIENSKEDLIKAWFYIGEIEAAISVLNYTYMLDEYCNPIFTTNPKIIGKDTYHPLLKEPVKNHIYLEKPSLITGSNASGKSTYIKSIAINAILAQSINLALASEFSIKKGGVFTSMAITDNVIEGDSYFIAEIKSLKRIVKDIENNNYSYYFVDEILRGTNTLERIAASSSIIEFFIKNNSMAFVASHDIELTTMFSDKVENLHFRENITENDEIEFDYTLYKGPSMTRNALKLLEVLDYPKEITENSKDALNYFLENNKWK